MIYLWSIWDAYSSAGGRILAPGLPFFMLFVVAFVIGWDVTQINIYKAITEISDIVPRLSQIAWPWDQAFVTGEVNTQASGNMGDAMQQRRAQSAGRNRRGSRTFASSQPAATFPVKRSSTARANSAPKSRSSGAASNRAKPRRSGGSRKASPNFARAPTAHPSC